MKSKSTTLWIILITIPALAILAGVFLWPRFKKAWDEQGKPSKAAVNLSVVAEVDVATYLLELADPESVDDLLCEAIAATQQATQQQLKDVRFLPVVAVQVFSQKFRDIVGPTERTLYYYYSTLSEGGDTTDPVIIAKLQAAVNKAWIQTTQAIGRRLNQYSVGTASVTTHQGTLVMELENVYDQEELRELLQTRGKLEFKIVRNEANAVRVFKQIDKVLANSDSIKRERPLKTSKAADTAVDPNDPYSGLPDEEKTKRYMADHPFTALFQTIYRPHSEAEPQDVTTIYAASPDAIPKGEYDFYTSKQGVTKLKELLSQKKIRSVLPWDNIVMFSARGISSTGDKNDSNAVYSMFMVDREVQMTGRDITSASFSYDDQTGLPVVYFDLNDEGTQQWSMLTGNNIKKRLAIVLDSNVYSAPMIQSHITTGSCMISGLSSLRDAKLISVMLPHPLPIPVKIVQLIQKQ